MSVIALGLNHTTAPLDVRGRFAFPTDRLVPTLRAVRERFARACEVALVSTCTRTELYVGAHGASVPELSVSAPIAFVNPIAPPALTGCLGTCRKSTSRPCPPESLGCIRTWRSGTSESRAQRPTTSWTMTNPLASAYRVSPATLLMASLRMMCSR